MQTRSAVLAPTEMQFPSRSGGSGHVVKVRTAKDGSTYLTCSCPGGRFAWAGDPSGRGCWAMEAARAAGMASN